MQCEKNAVWIPKDQNKMISKDALLRIYSKLTLNCYSFGYFRIRYRKREPKFEVKLAYVKPFPFSIHFKELENPIAARVLPYSVDVSLLTNEYDEIPATVIATKEHSSYPFAQSFLMSLRLPFDFTEARIEVRFEDEHEGYYDFTLPTQRIGYAEFEEKETLIYVPEEMAQETVFVSPTITEKLTPKSSKGDFSQFIIPPISIFCDRGDTNLLIQKDFLTEFLSKLQKQELTCSPDRTCMVSSAPISLELSSLSIAKDLEKVCRNITLSWWVRHWGLGKGPDKRQPFTLPVRFELLPEEIESVRRIFDTSVGSFEGYIDIELLFEMEGGYVLKHGRETFKIISPEKLLESIEDKIWLFLKQKEKLVSDLLRIFHLALDSDVPFDVFQHAVKGDETALYKL